MSNGNSSEIKQKQNKKNHIIQMKRFSLQKKKIFIPVQFHFCYSVFFLSKKWDKKRKTTTTAIMNQNNNGQPSGHKKESDFFLLL